MAKPRPMSSWPLPLLESLASDARYLVGVSGGRDSIALLHLLRARRFHRLVVCHLDHGLRGRAAAADARFVRELAERAGLTLEEARCDVRALARERKLSLEAAARAARYAFFVEVARRRRCPRIFLAHHADDLVETFLINLFRGAGPSGLSSIRETSVPRVGRTQLTVLRPMLGLWRSEIDAYVDEHALPFREDASNKHLDPLRNRLRHSIIPQIEAEIGRPIRKNIWRAAQIFADEQAALESLTPKTLGEARGQPLALQRRVVRRWLLENEVADVGFELIERVRALLDPASGVAKVNLPGDRHARRRAGKFFLE